MKTAKTRSAKKRAAKATRKRPVSPIPPGHPAVSAYLIVDGAADALAFYRKAFGAKELMRHVAPGGKIGHAEVRIGDSIVMLADEHPEVDARGPRAFGGSPVRLHVYVKDVDAVAAQAIAAGARVVRPVQDQFYGDRSGTITDPFGHKWTIATHTKDIPVEELQKLAAQHTGS